jgi:hypothetical protein
VLGYRVRVRCLLNIFIKYNIAFIFDKLAGGERAVESSDERGLIFHVVRAEGFSDGFGGLLIGKKGR